MQLRWKLLVVVATAALSGCFPPTFKHLLGTASSDPALIGTWKFKPDSGSVGFYHFLTGKDGNLTVIMVPEKGAASDVATLSLTPTRLGAARFLNVTMIANPAKDTKTVLDGFLPVLYRFDDADTLSLYLPDEDLAKAAIVAHKLAGSTGSPPTGDAQITSNNPQLGRFFSSRAGLALFAKRFEVLHRVN